MTREEHVINCAREVIEGYEFKLGAVLDSDRRVIHHKNRADLQQLSQALMSLEEEDDPTLFST